MTENDAPDPASSAPTAVPSADPTSAATPAPATAIPAQPAAGQPYPTAPYPPITQPAPYQPGAFQPVGGVDPPGYPSPGNPAQVSTAPYPAYPMYQSGGAPIGYPAYPPSAADDQSWNPYASAPMWAPVTKPKRRTGLIVGIVVLAVLAACGVAGGVIYFAAKSVDKPVVTAGGTPSPTVAPTPTDTPTVDPTPTVAPTVAVPLGSGTALKSLLVKPPSGARHVTIPGSSNGVLSLSQFVAAHFRNSSDSRAFLSGLGLKVACEEGWISSGHQYDIQLMQFADTDGATAFTDSQYTSYGRDKTITARYSLTGLPGGYGYERSKRDKFGNHEAILMASYENVVVVLFVYTPQALSRSAELALMTRQIDALK